MTLFVKYGKNFSPVKLISTYVFLAAISTPLLLQLAPAKIYDFTLAINTVICKNIFPWFFVPFFSPSVFFSRAPQIYSNFANKSTGQLAAVTSALNTGGSIARTFTVLAEAPDTLVLVILCPRKNILNIIVWISLFWLKILDKQFRSSSPQLHHSRLDFHLLGEKSQERLSKKG